MSSKIDSPTRAYCFVWLSIFATCPSLFAQTSVTTQHNDIGRTGQNLTETQLTPANVNASSFGKLFALPVDGQVYAQPLYLPSVMIGGVPHRVVFTATEHDGVYAFDAATGASLWKASLFDTAHGAAAGATPDPESDTGCGDISALNGSAEYGITSTPVIDPASGTLYVISKTLEGNPSYPVQRMHALDVTTGNEKFNGPVTLAASVSGSGAGSSGGIVKFDAKWENQRPGLLLLNGNVYAAFASHCDSSPWHGWILGYSASTLAQTAVFVTTPNGSASGIWMGGAGLAADVQNGVGRIFPVTGNGTYDATIPYQTNTMDYGDDILNLNLSSTGALSVVDEFTPDNQAALSAGDLDLASGGALVLPDQPGNNPHLLAVLGKTGTIFLVNRDDMGGYSTSSNGVVQQVSASGGLWGMPAYWNGNLYVWPSLGKLNQYSLTNGLLSTSPVDVSTQAQSAWFGSTPSVSANGATNGIVWSIDWSQTPGVLYAHNATNVSQMLWSSAQNATRDSVGTPVKFVVPTIADGNVFVGANNQLEIYGSLASVTPSFTLSAFPAALSVVPGSSVTTQIALAPLNGFTGSATFTASGLPTGVTASFSAGVLNLYTLTLTAAASAPVTSLPQTVTITGTGNSANYVYTLPVSVSNTLATPVNVSSAANVYGNFFYLSPVTNGGLDTESYAYPANILGNSIYALGVPFSFGTPGTANAVAKASILLPAGSFTTLNLLAVAVNGNQTNQTFVVTYTDGTSSTFTQSLSDWLRPQTYTGETTALAATYRLSPGGGAQIVTSYVYGYSFALNGTKTVQSVTLPANRNVVVMAATLAGAGSGSPTGTTPQTITFGAISTQTATTTLGLTAKASSGLAVSYSSSTASVCTVSGTTASFLTSGTCTIVAMQPGNSTYAAAPAVSQSFAVNKAAQNITFNSIAAQKVGTPLTLSASASSGLAVSFSSSTTSVCTVKASTATFVAAGTCTIVASQAGNSTYSAAANVSQSFTVAAAPKRSFKLSAGSSSVTVIPPTCHFGSCHGGTTGTDKITVTPVNGFTGAVAFKVSGLPAGVTAAFSPTTVTTSGATTITLTPSPSAGTGKSTKLTVTGTAGSGTTAITATTTFTLHY